MLPNEITEDFLEFNKIQFPIIEKTLVNYTELGGSLTFNSGEAYTINEQFHRQLTSGLATKKYAYSVDGTIDEAFVSGSTLNATLTNYMFDLELRVGLDNVSSDVEMPIVNYPIVKNSAAGEILGRPFYGPTEMTGVPAVAGGYALRYDAPLTSVGITIDQQTVTLTGTHAGTYTLPAQTFTTEDQIFNGNKVVTLVAV